MNNKKYQICLSVESEGDTCERLASSLTHKAGLPILIAPDFLRRMGCGQIDLCIINKEKEGKIYELKSYGALSPRQRLRVIRSGFLLSRILGVNVDCFTWFFRDEIIFPLN